MAKRQRTNGDVIRWGTFIVLIIVFVAGVVLYGSNVTAAADQNTVRINELRMEQREMLQILRKIDRTQAVILSRLGIQDKETTP